MSSDQVESVKGTAGAKIEQAQRSFKEGTQVAQDKAQEGSAQIQDKAGEAKKLAQQKTAEGKEQAGNIFQQAQRAAQNAIDTLVNEIKSKIAKVDSEHGPKK